MQARGRVAFHEVEVKDLEAAFQMIEEELEKAIKESGQETRSEWVKGSLFLGSMKLYFISVGSKIAGWVMTELTHGSRGSWINLPFGHSRPSECDGVDIFYEAMQQLKETCEQMGFLGVRLMSVRKGMYRRATGKLGMKPRFIEYVLEVNE